MTWIVRKVLFQLTAVTLAAGAIVSPVFGEQASNAVKALIDFDKNFTKPTRTFRIGYLTECVSNPYCQSRMEGMKAASKKFGFEFKVFDADFNPASQAKLVQNAVTEKFDGYVLGPTASQIGCSLFHDVIQPTGAPVATVAIPMCGNPDHTPGLAATLSMNTPAYYKKMVNWAFSSCDGPCKVIALGGYVGTDLFNYWQAALKQGVEDHPNVKLVLNEPANFDPRPALKKTQDALLSNPDVTLIITSWDDMTRGAESAVQAAGKVPGKDIKIFSAGATKIGVQKILEGKWNGSMAFLPYQEAYYAAAAVIMALTQKPLNAYIDEGQLPEIADTTGTVFITKENAAKYKADY